MPISVASPRELRGLARPLAALVRAALRLERRRAGEIAIVLTNDEELRALNRRWRGIDRATDVLSFPYEDRRGVVSGDLVVSLDRVRAQACRFRVGQGRELARLVVHGALHLAGLDHHAPAERAHMRRQEDEALAASRVVVRSLESLLARLGTETAR